MTKRKYGWVADRPDPRDYAFKVLRALPITTTNNRNTLKMPERFDQGQLGSCTGNSMGGVGGFLILNGHVQATKPCVLPLSRLMAYFDARSYEGTTASDSGATIRDVVKGFAQYGICEERLWKYDITKFAKKPPKRAYKNALQFEALTYSRLDNTNLDQLVNCLQGGLPFIFGFTVFSSFESPEVAKSGIVPMPDLKKEKVLGGHAVWAIDYDADKKGFWVVNSWGNDWGLDGLFFMPEAYMTSKKLATDFWVVQQVK